VFERSVSQSVHDLIDFNINDRPAGLTDAQWQAAVQRQEAIDNKIAVSLDYLNASQQAGGSILVAHTVGGCCLSGGNDDPSERHLQPGHGHGCNRRN